MSHGQLDQRTDPDGGWPLELLLPDGRVAEVYLQPGELVLYEVCARVMQRNATQRNATQRNAMLCIALHCNAIRRTALYRTALHCTAL